MIWHSVDELKDLGPPRLRDHWWALLGLPLFLGQLSFALYRIGMSFYGEPLLVFSWFDFSIEWTDSLFKIVAGCIFYLCIVTALIGMIWGCILSIQHWLYYHSRRNL